MASSHAGHVSLDQLKVMSAIENCRTAALGGHVARCEDCAYTTIAYNSCLMGTICNGELAGSGDARIPDRPQIPGDCLPFSSP